MSVSTSVANTASAVTRPNPWRKFVRNNGSVILIYAIIIVLAGIASIFSDRFLTPSNLLNIARQSIVLGLLAIGQTLVLLTGGMDISSEQVSRLVGLTVATIFAANASNPALILPLILLGVVMGAVLGGINGLLITHACGAVHHHLWRRVLAARDQPGDFDHPDPRHSQRIPPDL
ncbi:MAG: ABC transporter permease [Anaerolineales bacterium]|nr:ABC transporter permease [Anaerolineales bacterium]